MCYDDNARPPLPRGEVAATNTADLVLTSADGTQFAAYAAAPESDPIAQLIILPDIRGLHGFYKDLALRFAQIKIAAVAIDYFGRTAGLTARDDSFEFMPHVQQLKPDQVFADVRAALDYQQGAVGPDQARFTLGFCMGGTLSFLCGTQELGLTGVVGFYAGLSRDFGGGTLLDRAAQIRVPALGLFGGADQGIPVAQVQAFDRALDTAGVPHTITIYPDAPHSFFDRRATDFAAASADAWQRVYDFVSTQAATTTHA